MFNKIQAALTAGLVGFSSLAQAAPGHGHTESTEHVHGTHQECPLPKDVSDILKCIQKQHPKIIHAQSEFQRSDKLVDMAASWQNPEFEIEQTSGDVDSVNVKETTMAVVIPIEIGGKISARKDEAKAQAKLSEVELLKAQSEVTLEAVLKLSRLRQLDIEKSILSEAIKMYSQVVSQQKSRLNLSAEQRISLSVFKMAASEAQIRFSKLFEEEKALENYFHIATGHSLSELRAVIPKTVKAWPNVIADSEVNRSVEILHAKAETELAQAQLSLAQASSWPELKLGPVISTTESGEAKEKLYGFQLSFEIPVFNLNRAGRSYSKMGYEHSKVHGEYIENQENHNRAELVKVYQRIVDILKDSPAIEELEKSNKSQSSSIRQGLISAPLIIESYRQMEEFVQSRHERELKATEILWQLYNIDGKILTESL